MFFLLFISCLYLIWASPAQQYVSSRHITGSCSVGDKWTQFIRRESEITRCDWSTNHNASWPVCCSRLRPCGRQRNWEWCSGGNFLRFPFLSQDLNKIHSKFCFFSCSSDSLLMSVVVCEDVEASAWSDCCSVLLPPGGGVLVHPVLGRRQDL